MRVHPAPPPRHHRRKDLRRLPHIFAKVLELPIHSSADVTIHETSNSFKFIVSTTDISGEIEISADIIEIYPGVKKVVIRGYEESEIDMWRYRLPEDTRVEMASAVYGDGELVVTVPKEMERAGFEARSASGRLVLVQ